jgi:hypothetical protein
LWHLCRHKQLTQSQHLTFHFHNTNFTYFHLNNNNCTNYKSIGYKSNTTEHVSPSQCNGLQISNLPKSEKHIQHTNPKLRSACFTWAHQHNLTTVESRWHINTTSSISTPSHAVSLSSSKIQQAAKEYLSQKITWTIAGFKGKVSCIEIS